MMPIAINGRFLTQGMTGVQRFAREITAATDRLMGNDAWPQARLLMPSSVAQSPFAYLKAEAIGQKSGQLWEQWELPKAATGSFLINLGNTAPLMLGRGQAVVIHDAGVFDTPESYSFAFRTWYRAAALLWPLEWHPKPLACCRKVAITCCASARISAFLRGMIWWRAAMPSWSAIRQHIKTLRR